jgi:ABC-2 type transport system permease protein
MTALRAPPTVAQTFACFWALAQKTAQTKLTYRLATVVSLMSSVIAYGVFLLVWREIYRQNPRPGPFSRDQMLAYLVVAFLVNAILTIAVELRFLQRVRLGLIACDLVRPLGFVFFQLAQATGDALVNVTYALPIYLLAWWLGGPALLPASASAAGLGCLSLAFGFLIGFGVSYLMVQAAFLLQSGYGVFFARAALHQMFSGLSAPIVMFPPLLRDAASFLPFRHEIETPARIWLGYAHGSEVYALLATQATWGLGLVLAGDLVFRAVMRHHQIQGG